MSASRSESPPEEDQPNHGYVLPEGKIMPNTVFVGGIDIRMDEIEIKEFFSKFGAVKEVKIITDRTGISKGYGFVSFYDDVDVQKIVDSHISFHGKKLKLGPAIRKQVCSYAPPRPVVLSAPAPQYPSIYPNIPTSDPYLQHTPLFSPITQYVQAYPYCNNAPVMFQHIPLAYQQPGYYQVSPQWPNGDQRSYISPQAFTSWNYHGSEIEVASNDLFPPDFNSHDQNASHISTSPQKKVDRSIQTIVSCLLNGDGRLQRNFFSQEDYLKKSPSV
ncbi:deleted in azoospermia-like isoform X1 [Pseudophryne corroboree]|uniref:deleted in azoospermia-like isoform X1 n=1 Tax=Pseudophryne corroboree TaxID=495146 RepID=UPI0030821AC6